MKVLMFVLNDPDLLEPLLKEFGTNGIKGCTIFDSNGMGRELYKRPDEFGGMFGGLRAFLNPSHKNTKTLMLVLNDDKVAPVVECIEKVVGSLDSPGTGIVFTYNLDFVKGIKL